MTSPRVAKAAPAQTRRARGSRVTGWGGHGKQAPVDQDADRDATTRAGTGRRDELDSSLFEDLGDDARKRPGGSRNWWPRCGARTKGKPGKREPGRCKAAGQGVGGRCMYHGGAHVGWPVGEKRHGKKGRRQLVLFSGTESLLQDAFNDRRERRRWHMMALPLDLYERLPPEDVRGAIESAYISFKLEEAGVARKIAQKWPQRLGYRVILRLAERGRIAFALVSEPRDVKRAARLSVHRYNERSHRIGPCWLLVALRAAGQSLRGKEATA